jgi:hypothetical protein
MPTRCSEVFVESLSREIEIYEKTASVEHVLPLSVQIVHQIDITSMLQAMYMYCMQAASMIGLTQQDWDDFWDDVQRANMTKERCERPADSKRGSVWDVIKPAGWVSPQTEHLLLKKLGEADAI